MKLVQLKYLCKVVDCGYNISKAASQLYTSQPSVSRHIQELEDELGITIFSRGKKRIIGLTSPGAEALKVARRMVHDSRNLQQIGREYTSQDHGRLVITTTHTHARYVLPAVIEQFRNRHPKVHLSIKQGNPVQLIQWVSSGEADLSISSEPQRADAALTLLPCSEHPIVVLVPREHPLRGIKHLKISHLVDQPIITYNSEFSIHSKIMHAFQRERITPNIVLSATDVDVMKTYVKQGLGIAIITSAGYDRAQDHPLRALGAKHLFGSTRICLGVRRFSYLRSYAFDFINLFSPSLSRSRVEQAILEG